MKAEVHSKRIQELRELGIQPIRNGPIRVNESTEGQSPVISDRTVSSTTIDIPRSQTPESAEGKFSLI